MDAGPADALSDLRRTRRIRRLGDLEWFELAYRVYLTALLGGLGVVVVSDLVGDAPATPDEVARVVADGPAWLGVVAALAVAIGARGGADGGPVALEPADVRHLLLAPVPRRAILLRPLGQRVRAVAFGAALTGAIAGTLAAQRLPGSGFAWAGSGALAGALVGALTVAVAALVHELHAPRWAASLLGLVVVGVQVATAWRGADGPFDRFGSLAMWGMDQRATDLVAAAAVAVLLVASLALVGRLRVEPLVRRGDLVSQLRFAVTVQDLRTVVILRRQLREELPRRRPWVTVPRRGGSQAAAVRRRGARSLARTPASRLARMVLTSIGAGVAAVAVLRDVTPAIVPLGVLLFLLGLDAIEPLSQEIDHPDRTDALPHERGWIHLHLLVAPLATLAVVSLAGATVVALAEPGSAAAAYALAVPVAWGGAIGSVVSAIRDQPGPATAAETAVVVPPEFAGMTTALRIGVPLVISTLAATPVIAMRERPDAAMALRSALGVALVLTAAARWVARRDRWRRAREEFVAGARS